MRRILFVASALLAWPAIGQTPIDPPVASLPLPNVAVEQLSAAPSRVPGRSTASPTDAEAAAASPRYVLTRRPPTKPTADLPRTGQTETRFIRKPPQ